MKVIIFVNADDPVNMQILEDENGERLIFNSHEEAEDHLMNNAKSGNSYMHWDGER